jgi:adhesin transport system membrane fusion protein
LAAEGGDVQATATRTARRFALYMFGIIGLFLVVFSLWASFATLDEITRGDGKVIPTGQNKVVQHLEGGIVAAILVREGDTVRDGQVLLRIDNTSSRASVGEKRAKYYALMARAARLRAEAENKPAINFPKEVIENAPDEARQEAAHFRSRTAQRRSELSVLESQVAQRQQALAETLSEVRRLGALLVSLQREQAQTERDLKSGAVSETELREIQRKTDETAGRLRTERLAILRAQSALREAKDKIDEKTTEFMSDVRKDLADAENQIASLAPVIFAGDDKVSRTDIRSPIAGTIKQIGVNTIGAVIKPGQPLIEIVPVEDTLMVEARIKPQDRAFLRPDQPATVKLTAYDYSIYGGIDGKVVDISADAIQDENKKNETYYRIRIRTKRNYLEYGGAKLAILPGMTASVDINTGKKTVLSYIADPILKVFNESLRER